VRLRKGTLLIALVLLIGLGTGSASGATERLEEVSSFSFDYRGVDLAWDGEYLWATDPNEDKIYKLDTSGNVLSSFDSPNVVPRGITWDGEHLWVNSSSRRRIYEIDTSGNVISSFTTIDAHYDGLAWDGEHLWNNETIELPDLKIVEYDTTGNVVSSFDFTPSSGMTWDGEYLWVAASDGIYKLDTSGNVISSFDPPSAYPSGLAWDGEHLWVSDVVEGRIYQLRVTTDNEAQFSLNVSLDPPEGGSVTLDPPGGTYPEGTVVTLTAAPAENYGFAGWSGDASGTSSTITVTMDSDKSVTAHFVKVGEPEGEGVPLSWIAAGAGAVIALLAVLLYLKRLRE